MAKKFIDSISVKSPCSESWDEMSGNANVRFCSHCSKDVHDLSEMTRRQAEALVKRSNGNLCVRYRADQNGKIITQPPVLTRITRRATVAAGVLAASLAAGTAAYAQGSTYPKATEKPTELHRISQNDNNKVIYEITGTITDVNGLAIPEVIVTLVNIKDSQTTIKAISSPTGQYSFKGLKPGTYGIMFESDGFIRSIIQNIEVQKEAQTVVNGTLQILDVTEIVGVVAISSSETEIEQPLTKISNKIWP